MLQRSIPKLARALWHSGWAARAVGRYGWPRKVIFYNGGVGDDLLCTTVAHELRKRDAGRIWVATKYLELFEGNPDASVVPISIGDLVPADCWVPISNVSGTRNTSPKTTEIRSRHAILLQ